MSGRLAFRAKTARTVFRLVRGPVTVHQAISISPVDINSMQITKSVNGEPGEKGSDTMGSKHMVEFDLFNQGSQCPLG